MKTKRWFILSIIILMTSFTCFSQQITGKIIDKNGNRYLKLQNGNQEETYAILAVMDGFNYYITDSILYELSLDLVCTYHSGHASFIISFSKTIFPAYNLHKGFISESVSVKSDDLKGFDQRYLPKIENGYLIIQTDKILESIPIGIGNFDFRKTIYNSLK